MRPKWVSGHDEDHHPAQSEQRPRSHPAKPPKNRTPPGASQYTPSKAAFTLRVRSLSEECFGSAGYNLEFRLRPAYTGQEFDPDQTVEVMYQVVVVGSDDDCTNTFTMTGDTNAPVDERESVRAGTAGKIAQRSPTSSS